MVTTRVLVTNSTLESGVLPPSQVVVLSTTAKEKLPSWGRPRSWTFEVVTKLVSVRMLVELSVVVASDEAPGMAAV